MSTRRPTRSKYARFNPDAAAEPAKPPARPDGFYPDVADEQDSQASFVKGLNQFQLWNQANGGDPWSMWELNRRGITSLPARPNPAQFENPDQINYTLLERDLRNTHPEGVRVFVNFGEATIRVTGSLSRAEMNQMEQALQDRGLAPLGSWRTWSGDELGKSGATLRFDKAETIKKLMQVQNLEDLKKLALKKNPSELPRIEDWFVHVTDDGDRHLFGRVYGHPRHKDGHPIQTSAVDRAQGRTVLTRSGTAYQLGAPASPARSARTNPKVTEWILKYLTKDKKEFSFAFSDEAEFNAAFEAIPAGTTRIIYKKTSYYVSKCPSCQPGTAYAKDSTDCKTCSGTGELRMTSAQYDKAWKGETAKNNPRAGNVAQQVTDWLRKVAAKNMDSLPEVVTVISHVRFKRFGRTQEAIVENIEKWLKTSGLTGEFRSNWKTIIDMIRNGKYAAAAPARNNPQGMNMTMIMGEDGGPMGGEWADWAQNREGIMHRNPRAQQNPKAFFGKGGCTLCKESMYQGDDVEVFTQVHEGKEYKSYVHEECLKRYNNPELFKAAIKKAVRKKVAVAKKNHHIPIGGYAKFKGVYLKVISDALPGNEQGEYPGVRMFYHGVGAAKDPKGKAVTFRVIVPDDARWTLGVSAEHVPSALLAALERDT